MGKRKIEIEKIDDKDKRMVTFSKRRQGLFKKAAAVCRDFDCNISLIVFSPAGKSFSFGHPSVDAVIDQFLLTGTTTTGKEDEKEICKTNNNLYHKSMGAGCEGDGDGFWWDNIDMEELDSMEKLQNVKNALLGLKQNVVNRIDKLTSSSSSSSSAATTTTTTVEDPSLFLTEGYHLCWPSDDELEKLLNYNIDEMRQQQQLPPLTDHQADLPFSEDEPAAELVKSSFNKNNDETWQQLTPFTDHQADLLPGSFSEDELAKSFNADNDETWHHLFPQ